MTRDERLLAYVDGELGQAELAAFEAEMATDPTLAAEVAAHRDLRRRLFGAYSPIVEEPPPPQLLAVASAANEPGRRRFGLVEFGGLAACLAIALAVGQALPGRGDLVMKDERLTARGELASALSHKLAADPGLVRVGLSFRARDGRYCRTFTSERDGLAGVACRDEAGWRAEATSAWRPAAESAYRTAGSETSPAVLAAVDGLIDGEPLDAAGERRVRDLGWRP